MKKILVVEDDPVLNKTLCYNLTNSDYQIRSAATAADAIRIIAGDAEAPGKTTTTKKAYLRTIAAAENVSAITATIPEDKNTAAGRFDLAILDINLPDGSGFDLCKEIKSSDPACAVIFLTARDMEEDMLSGFQLGAEDYVTKPFPISVLQKKIELLLRRRPDQPSYEIYDDGTLHINFSEMSTTLKGTPVAFTATEYRILKLMIANAGVVLTRQILLEKLWDVNENFVDEHALTSAISRIRNKIEKNGDQYIKTVYGMGYMWIGGPKK